MDIRKLVFGERSLTKVAGVFATAAAADDARARVVRGGRWTASQVMLLTPGDVKLSRREIIARTMEPESRGIWKTILRAHLVTGLIGFALGVVAWGLLRYSGNQLIVSSPGLSLIAIVFFATIFGLMLGGLISLRPDHAELIDAVRGALQSGHWVVVVHPFDAPQAEHAVELLRDGSVSVERTI